MTGGPVERVGETPLAPVTPPLAGRAGVSRGPAIAYPTGPDRSVESGSQSVQGAPWADRGSLVAAGARSARHRVQAHSARALVSLDISNARNSRPSSTLGLNDPA